MLSLDPERRNQVASPNFVLVLAKISQNFGTQVCCSLGCIVGRVNHAIKLECDEQGGNYGHHKRAESSHACAIAAFSAVIEFGPRAELIPARKPG